MRTFMIFSKRNGNTISLRVNDVHEMGEEAFKIISGFSITNNPGGDDPKTSHEFSFFYDTDSDHENFMKVLEILEEEGFEKITE